MTNNKKQCPVVGADTMGQHSGSGGRAPGAPASIPGPPGLPGHCQDRGREHNKKKAARLRLRVHVFGDCSPEPPLAGLCMPCAATSPDPIVGHRTWTAEHDAKSGMARATPQFSTRCLSRRSTDPLKKIRRSFKRIRRDRPRRHPIHHTDQSIHAPQMHNAQMRGMHTLNVGQIGAGRSACSCKRPAHGAPSRADHFVSPPTQP